MKCKGFWAAKYGHNMSLSYEEIDKTIMQAKKLGIHFFMYTGGEPLLRKDDLVRLCKKHAGVAELADARDLKSLGEKSPYRFDSGPRHQKNDNIV